jgi:hypothetical protein
LDLLGTDEDVVLYSDKPFVQGDDSDECEEEVDDDDGTELEAYYKSIPNEYETDEQFEEALAAGTDGEEGESDFEGFTDFEGFSDENDALV